MSRYRRLFITCTALLALTAAAPTFAYNYNVCVRFQIQTTDSAEATDSPREDHYLGANNGITVTARGVRINIYKNGASVTGGDVNTNPSSGCYSFVHGSNGTFSIRVYGRASDAAGNMVRIHDSPLSFSSYPGQTYSIWVPNFTPTPNATTYVDVGGYTSRWTMMAVAAFSLYRYHDGISNKNIHIGEANSANECSNSSWFGQSNDFLTAGRAYIKINSGGACSDDRAQKFLIAHEIGHTVMRLYAKLKEGPWTSGFNYAGGVAACTNVSSYDMNSVEWGSVGFKEGTADLYSAAVFNYEEPTGRYIRFGQEIDLEFNNPAAAGGRLVNNCNVSSNNGQGLGIRSDWLRFWWDWVNDLSCNPKPSRLHVMQVFKRTLENHYGVGDGAATPFAYTDSTAYGATRYAAELLLPNCKETEYRFHACWNGVDRESGQATNGCY